MFPPHKTYVEPFLGGGAVFFEKEPSEKEVVNDLDSKLVADYARIKKAPLTGYKVLTTESAQNAFLQQKNKGVAGKVLESLIRRCNGFGGTYIDGTEVAKTTTHEDKLKNLGEYKKRLNHATLTNEGYDAVLRKYDGPDTFFFMDPPYEKSVGLDYAEGSDKFPFAKFAEDVKGLKGKFIVTINDSRAIRKLFKGLHIYPYVVVGHHAEGAGADDRKELLVTNYVLPRMWKSTLTGGATHRENVLKKLKPTGVSLPELAEASGVAKDVLQQVYNRGIGAYKTNPESVRKKNYEKGPAPMSEKLSKEQWAKARVYSFLDGNPKHDTDLRQQSLLARRPRRGGARGVMDDNRLWNSAMRRAEEFAGVGGGCGIFGLVVLRDYLNRPINIRRYLAATRRRGDGSLALNEVRGALSDDLEVEEAVNYDGQKWNPLSPETVLKYYAKVHDEGGALLIITKDHLTTALPIANEDGTYNPVLFDCQRDGPSQVQPTGIIYVIFYIGAEPLNVGGGSLTPASYLRAVRAKAKKAGYDPKSVKLSEDGTHKLEIQTPDGRTVKFGRVGYGDFLIWTHKEKRGEAPKGIAKMKRKVFHLSHSAIKGDWKDDKFSPNNLALALLW